MNKRILLTFLGVCSGVMMVTADDNLVLNAGFEDTAPSARKGKNVAEKLDNWSPCDWTGAAKAEDGVGLPGVKTSSDAAEGKASALLFCDGRPMRANLLIQQQVNFTPGAANYVLSFKFKKGPGAAENVSVFGAYLTTKTDADGKRVNDAYVNSPLKLATSKWQELVMPFKVSADAKTLQIMLRSNGTNILFDDVKLVKTE